MKGISLIMIMMFVFYASFHESERNKIGYMDIFIPLGKHKL